MKWNKYDENTIKNEKDQDWKIDINKPNTEKDKDNVNVGNDKSIIKTSPNEVKYRRDSPGNSSQHNPVLHLSTAKSRKSETTEATIKFNSNTTSFDLYKGLIFMLVSCLFKSLYSILLKFEMNRNPTLTPFQLMTWRTFIMLWMTIILGYFYRHELKISETNKKTLTFVLIRSALAVVSTPLLICSLKVLTISDVYSIFYIYPGLIILFTMTSKGGKVGALDYICLVSCFIGVLCIVKPDFIFGGTLGKANAGSVLPIKIDSNSTQIILKSALPEASIKEVSFFKSKGFYFILVAVAALVKAVEDICVKHAGKNIHFLMYFFVYAVFGICFFPVIMIISKEPFAPFDLIDCLLFFLIAITSCGYISFMALGLRNENAGRVSMINYLQVVFMYMSDIFLFGKDPTLLDFTGTMLIFSLNTLNSMYKAMKRSSDLSKFQETKTLDKAIGDNKVEKQKQDEEIQKLLQIEV